MDGPSHRAPGPDLDTRTPVADDDASVSVVIPVKDAGEDLRRLLSALRNQRGLNDVEIVVVDSGSTDRSPDVAREFGATVLRIPPEEFSHSGSRNLGARHARGGYLFFTVQDALPSSDSYLRDLVDAMKQHDVAAVSCVECPKTDADLFYRTSSWFHNRFMEVDSHDRIMSRPSEEDYFTLRKNSQLSNVACLISKSLFLEYGFRGRFAEDLDLGLRLIKDGRRLALLSSTRIIHSHNRPPYYHLKRGYVDALLLSQLFPDFRVPVVEADDLCREVVAAFSVVDSIVRTELEHLTVPCQIGRLSEMVFQSLQRPRPRVAAPVAHDGRELVDPDLISFVQRLDDGSPRRCVEHALENPAVLNAVKGALGGIFEYMSATADAVDSPLLDDFKACFYKAYAIQCGVLFASSFVHGCSNTKERLRDINAELTRGI